MRIYLAGGFYADDWQKKVINEVEKSVCGKEHLIDRVKFFNPKTKGFREPEKYESALNEPSVYTNLDLFAIEKSDVVFAYIDKNNPAVGVIAEVGYSVASGKKVILVIEKDHVYFKDRYFDFLRSMKTLNASNLQDGIYILLALLNL